MSELQKSEALLHAVTHHKVDEVKRLLEQSADPNYDSSAGNPEEKRDGQPYSPLRMVMFRISDNLLDDHALKEFGEIAMLLIEHGADPKPAMELAEERYGAYNPNAQNSPFMEVWRIVAEAKS